MTAVIGRTALRIDEMPERWPSLVSWSDLNRILEFGGLTYPRVKLLLNGREIPGGRYIRTGSNGYPRILSSAIRSAMISGATLMIDAAEQLYEPLFQMCAELELRLRVPVQVDVYASSASHGTDDLQWNDHEAFVFQIEGYSHWEIHRPTFGQATLGNDPPVPAGLPDWKGELEAGQALYVPRGWWYRDCSTIEPEFHARALFRNLTALDFVKRLTNHLELSSEMRTDFPGFGGVEAQSAFVGLIQREVDSACSRPGLILGCLQETQCFAEPRMHFALPWRMNVRSDLDSEKIGIAWRLRFPCPDLLKHLETGDAIELIVDGAPARFCGNTALVIERLLGSLPSNVGEAITECADLLGPEELAETLKELMNKDVLVLRTLV